MKEAVICLSIVATVVLCTLNVATASTGNYSTTFYNNARHTGDHMLMTRYSTSNGTLNRNYVTEGISTSSVTPNGTVYIGSLDHNFYALDVNTGAKVWSYATGDFVGDVPTVANGIVYVGSWDHNVYALNASTGAKVWSYTTGNIVWSSPVVVANGIVCVGRLDRNV